MFQTDFSNACGYLLQARKFGLKLGLETMRHLAGLLEHPESKLRFIHIAGTNGKGSTAAFCAAGLRAEGLRVGLFTSPHLCSIRERLQINGELISRADFAEGLRLVQRLAESAHLQPTFFEIITALGLWYFQRQKVDWVVWETGLGGRMDATNIVTPQVSIITNIALDHTEFLGSTLSAIAGEKAGIIKVGIPVVTAVSDPEPLQVIESVAAERGAPLLRVGVEVSAEATQFHSDRLEARLDGEEFVLGLTGEHQLRNAACAYAALKAVGYSEYRSSLASWKSGFSRATWPGRFQRIQDDPPIIIDGAHNLDAALALEASWSRIYGEKGYHLVFGALQDKPYPEMARVLGRRASRVSLVRVPSDRTATPEMVLSYFAGLPVQDEGGLEDVWPSLLQESEPVLIAGSLFLVGQALTLARPEEFPPEELSLNERLK